MFARGPSELVFLLLLVGTLQGCGGSRGGSEDGPSFDVATLDKKRSALIPCVLSLEGSRSSSTSASANSTDLNLSPNGLGLAAPGGQAVDSYAITLGSCSSGLSGANSAAGFLNVYLHDTHCLGKLTSFVLHGQTYLPSGSGSVPFSTWLAGDTATFVGSGSSDLIYVTAVSQLSSPILTTDVVSYSYSANKSGTNSATATVSNSQTIGASGIDAPNFSLSSSNAIFNGIITSGTQAGYGRFTFKLTCASGAMTAGANASYNSFCPTVTAGGTLAGGAAGTDIGANFSYVLIADPNGNGTLTIAQAASAFSGSSSTINLATDILSGSTGFTTNSMTGPGPLAANIKLILVLQAQNANNPSNPNYSSFQYFPITLPASN